MQAYLSAASETLSTVSAPTTMIRGMNMDDQYPELQAILSRIPPEWGKTVDVGPGWYSIVVELDKRLAEADPDYVVHQVKEEAGELDVRVDTAHADRYQAMRALIRDAEQRASHICELCGATGSLRVSRAGNVRRLCAECAAGARQGYMAVSSDLETRASLHRVAMQAAALHRLLSALPSDAAQRITGGEMDAVSQLARSTYEASIGDLNTTGRQAFVQQVTAHAAEMEGATASIRLTTVRIFEKRPYAHSGPLETVGVLEALFDTKAREERVVAVGGTKECTAYRISGLKGLEFLVFEGDQDNATFEFVVDDLPALRGRADASNVFVTGDRSKGVGYMPVAGHLFIATQRGSELAAEEEAP